MVLENELEVEWSSEGNLISSNCSYLKQVYQNLNEVVSICRIDKETIILNDEIGVVRLADLIVRVSMYE